MTADCLLDTNILVYAVDTTESNEAKREKALKLIAEEDFGLSAQVLQEFYVTVTRKIQKPLMPDQAMAITDRYAAFPMVPVDYGLIVEGVRNSVKYRISYWDGAIIAAAERLKCRRIYTEDLNNGQTYGTAEVCNPFSPS